jgi:hypothetical protein
MATELHKLRKGRERCAATRRDGWPCQAPAIPEGFVCRRHGGSAPQVRIAARHRQLQLALFVASSEFKEAAEGTEARFDALCRLLRAEEALAAYELKLSYLAELKAEVALRRAEDGWIRPSTASGNPAMVNAVPPASHGDRPGRPGAANPAAPREHHGHGNARPWSGPGGIWDAPPGPPASARDRIVLTPRLDSW